MNGHEFRALVGRYLTNVYGPRGVEVYEEVALGTSTLGKTRRIDLLAIERATRRALAIECKFQDSYGTTDEKIPYALAELKGLLVPGVIVYAGSGFSEGVLHLLKSCPQAAYCLPDESLRPLPKPRGADSIHRGTWQLDHVVAQTFGYWDVVIGDRKPVQLASTTKVRPEREVASAPNGQNDPATPTDPGPISTPTDG